MVKETAKDKIIQAAQVLMTSRGYAATTIDEIINRAGVSKGSFYHAFASKEDLAKAALEDYGQRGLNLISNGPHVRLMDPVEKAFALIDYLLDNGATLWAQGCMLGSVAMEVSDYNPALIKHIEGLFGYFEDNFGEIFTAALRARKVKGVTGKALATQLLVVIEGGIVSAKSHNDVKQIREALSHFRRYLELLLAIR